MSNSVALSGRFDPRLKKATEIIKAKIVEHCAGADLECCAADAAQEILREIIEASAHYHDGEVTSWKRMPPAIREAIKSAIGAKP